MQQWPTTLGVVVLTALFMVQHVRNRGGSAATSGKPCPRCRASVPDGAMHCPSCRAPMHSFAVVTAPIAPPVAASAGGTLHAIVRADACAGCGTEIENQIRRHSAERR